MGFAPTPLRAMLARNCGRSRPCLGALFFKIDWGARPKLSKVVDAAACKTGTRTRLHTFRASFHSFLYFPITTKSIHSQGGYHSRPTASEIIKMPANGGYLLDAPNVINLDLSFRTHILSSPNSSGVLRYASETVADSSVRGSGWLGSLRSGSRSVPGRLQVA